MWHDLNLYILILRWHILLPFTPCIMSTFWSQRSGRDTRGHQCGWKMSAEDLWEGQGPRGSWEPLLYWLLHSIPAVFSHHFSADTLSLSPWSFKIFWNVYFIFTDPIRMSFSTRAHTHTQIPDQSIPFFLLIRDRRSPP